MSSVNVSRDVNIEFTQEEIRNMKVACFALRDAASELEEEGCMDGEYHELNGASCALWDVLIHYCGETDDSLHKEWKRYQIG